MAEEKKSKILEVIAIAALLLLIWRLTHKKKLLSISELPPVVINVDEELKGDPNFDLNKYCDKIVYRPLSMADLTLNPLLGTGWCSRGDTSVIDKSKGYGDDYADKQASDYETMKEAEADFINTKSVVQFRLINSTSAQITINLLNTTQDPKVMDGTDDGNGPVHFVKDIDGNIYPVVTIGSQQWLGENLKCTKYSDGTSIPNLPLDADWLAEDGTPGHDGAFCDYDNDTGNRAIYGLLYDWHCAHNSKGLAYFEKDGIQELGWKVPSSVDWAKLNVFLGGETIAGGKLKEIGTVHWSSPNVGATDVFAFKALPSGFRVNTGSFLFQLTYFFNWLSDEYDPTRGYYNYIIGSDVFSNIFNVNKNYGMAIRCVRDI